MLSYLMHLIKPTTKWHVKILNLIDSHSIDTNKMGFPENYKKLPIWQ